MRNYQKKTKSYTTSDLMKVIQYVQQDTMSLRAGAKALGISPATLRTKIASGGCVANVDNRGKKTVISPGDEQVLADHLRTLTKWGYGLTRTDVRLIVQEYCKENKIMNFFKDGLPGKEWFQAFCRRQKLKLKATESLEKARRSHTSDPFLIYELYDILTQLATELDIADKPDRWWNLDECGINHDPTRCKAVAGTEQKGIHRTNQGSGRENTTAMACVSANGRNLAPLFIFKAQKLWSSWKGSSDLDGTFYSVSESGFINSDIFFDYFKLFCKEVTQRPLILLLDGHVSHLDFRTVQLARNENIAVVKLPSHTTDVLQPLDKSCFGPLKSKWNGALLEWQRLNNRQLTKSEFVDLVCQVWHQGISVNNICAGFRSCGIFPVDRTKYPLARFDPIKLEKYLQHKESQNAETSGEVTQQLNKEVALEQNIVSVLIAEGGLNSSNLPLDEDLIILDEDGNIVTNESLQYSVIENDIQTEINLSLTSSPR